MSHLRFGSAVILGFILLSANAFAQENDPLSEKHHSPICRGCHGIGSDLNPLTSAPNEDEDDPDAIRKRSGPGDPIAGKVKSELCQGCHGEDGNSYDPGVPKLAGQYGPYITKQVQNYQSGIRSHQIMNAMAATVSDKDLPDISAYFASQKKMAGPGTSFNLIGQKLFFHSETSRAHMACVNCHGVGGKGLRPSTPMFPVLGGQHKEYLLKQLLFFKNDDRVNSPNAIMNKVAKVLSNEELEALADYLAEQ